MAMPDRQKDILLALRNHPEGLQTAEIFSYCKKKLFSDLPDANITSQILYALREKKWTDRSDTIVGKRHTITTLGLSNLAKEIGEPLSQPITKKIIDDSMNEECMPENAVLAAQNNDSPITSSQIIDVIEQAAANLYTIKAMLNQTAPAHKISNKPRKVYVLEMLAKTPLFADDTAELLLAIRDDIDKAEAE